MKSSVNKKPLRTSVFCTISQTHQLYASNHPQLNSSNNAADFFNRLIVQNKISG